MDELAEEEEARSILRTQTQRAWMSRDAEGCKARHREKTQGYLTARVLTTVARILWEVKISSSKLLHPPKNGTSIKRRMIPASVKIVTRNETKCTKSSCMICTFILHVLAMAEFVMHSDMQSELNFNHDFLGLQTQLDVRPRLNSTDTDAVECPKFAFILNP